MAHEISFMDKNEKEETIFLFGYFSGIFYDKFGVKSFNMGLSGSNESITKSRLEVMSVLDMIKDSEVVKNYPDPKRFPEFYKEIKNSKIDDFIILFS